MKYFEKYKILDTNFLLIYIVVYCVKIVIYQGHVQDLSWGGGEAEF